MTSYLDSTEENLFENLVNLILKFLELLHSNANVEKCSQMNLIKPKLRNRIHINKLNAALTTKYAKPNFI